jgi:hypothetical protein
LRLDNWFGDWQFDDLIGLINSHMCIAPRHIALRSYAIALRAFVMVA